MIKWEYITDQEIIGEQTRRAFRNLRRARLLLYAVIAAAAVASAWLAFAVPQLEGVMVPFFLLLTLMMGLCIALFQIATVSATLKVHGDYFSTLDKPGEQ